MRRALGVRFGGGGGGSGGVPTTRLSSPRRRHGRHSRTHSRWRARGLPVDEAVRVMVVVVGPLWPTATAAALLRTYMPTDDDSGVG